MTFRGLYVDDERALTDEMIANEWCIARNAWEALVKLELLEFDEVSLDHDLASFINNKEITGYDILMWLVERKLNGFSVPAKVYVHSANPVGSKKMQEVIDQYWK